MASAVVYKWVDAQGKLQYGDRPPDGVHAEVVELLGTHVARSAAHRRRALRLAAAQDAADWPAAKDADNKKAVEQDVAQTREKQCADAQDRYKKLIEGRQTLQDRAPTANASILTSEEIDTERLNAKRDVDAICNSTT